MNKIVEKPKFKIDNIKNCLTIIFLQIHNLYKKVKNYLNIKLLLFNILKSYFKDKKK